VVNAVSLILETNHYMQIIIYLKEGKLWIGKTGERMNKLKFNGMITEAHI